MHKTRGAIIKCREPFKFSSSINIIRIKRESVVRVCVWIQIQMCVIYYRYILYIRCLSCVVVVLLLFWPRGARGPSTNLIRERARKRIPFVSKYTRACGLRSVFIWWKQMFQILFSHLVCAARWKRVSFVLAFILLYLRKCDHFYCTNLLMEYIPKQLKMFIRNHLAIGLCNIYGKNNGVSACLKKFISGELC